MIGAPSAAVAEDTVRFYRALRTFEERVGGTRRLARCDGRSGWPERRIHFFFEDGELRGGFGAGPRIVRGGTHALKPGGGGGGLRGRLRGRRGDALSLALPGSAIATGNDRALEPPARVGPARGENRAPAAGDPRQLFVRQRSPGRRQHQMRRGRPFLMNLDGEAGRQRQAQLLLDRGLRVGEQAGAERFVLDGLFDDMPAPLAGLHVFQAHDPSSSDTCEGTPRFSNMRRVFCQESASAAPGARRRGRRLRARAAARFYRALCNLEERVGGARRPAQCDGRSGWPERGVYFFFEDGESRSSSGAGPRVVRVGTHALKSGGGANLWSRLRGHRGDSKTGGGNHRGSIFRLLVGAALAERDPGLRVAHGAPAGRRRERYGRARPASSGG